MIYGKRECDSYGSNNTYELKSVMDASGAKRNVGSQHASAEKHCTAGVR